MMNDKQLYSDPTLNACQESEIRRKGPSICKKNIDRHIDKPKHCICSEAHEWPYCRWLSAGIRGSGFVLVDE